MPDSNKYRKLQELLKKTKGALGEFSSMRYYLEELIEQEKPIVVDESREKEYADIFYKMIVANGWKDNLNEVRFNLDLFLIIMKALESDDKEKHRQAVFTIEHNAGMHYDEENFDCNICKNKHW